MTLAAMQHHESVTLFFGDEDYRRKSLALLAKSHVIGKRVLDLRCLTGRLCVSLAKAGHQVRGFDGYAPAVEMTNRLARQEGILPIASVWDLTGLAARVSGERFDTVICLDLLNHVDDDQRLMADIAQVTRKGGQLIIAAPAHPSLIGPRDNALGHLRRYSRLGMKDLLARHGFKIIRMRYWNFLALPPYIILEKWLGVGVSDKLRYGRGRRVGNLPNRLLGLWYTTVENRLLFPCGLSWFVTAERSAKGNGLLE